MLNVLTVTATDWTATDVGLSKLPDCWLFNANPKKQNGISFHDCWGSAPGKPHVICLASKWKLHTNLQVITYLIHYSAWRLSGKAALEEVSTILMGFPHSQQFYIRCSFTRWDQIWDMCLATVKMINKRKIKLKMRQPGVTNTSPSQCESVGGLIYKLLGYLSGRVASWPRLDVSPTSFSGWMSDWILTAGLAN